LFDGRGNPLDDVMRALSRIGVEGQSQYYFREYGLNVTRDEIAGCRWVYRGNSQRERIVDDAKAGELVLSVLRLYDDGDVPENAFALALRGKSPMLKRAVDRCLRSLGRYIVDGRWSRFGSYTEIELEDRYWLLGADGELSWMLTEEDMAPGDIDGAALWEYYRLDLKDRFTKTEFLRCVEFVNMYKTLDYKVIFPRR
jgi:hypothetical protein